MWVPLFLRLVQTAQFFGVLLENFVFRGNWLDVDISIGHLLRRRGSHTWKNLIQGMQHRSLVSDSPIDVTRIYRTGDLVRILHDGTFDFAGRADDQVKLRGQRLEIGEINETLKQADSRVKAVTTLVLRHPKQQKDQLVSFIVLEAKNTVNIDQVVLDGPEQHEVIPLLANTCRRKLPIYMVPTHFLPISKMPLSVNNKADNKKLAAIYQGTPLALLQRISRREDTHGGNWTDAEQRIRKILVDMTGIQASEIKRSSTVFELGLDSVSVVGLARKLKKDGFFASSVSLVMQCKWILVILTVGQF